MRDLYRLGKSTSAAEDEKILFYPADVAKLFNTNDEIALFKKILRNANKYLEFGSGASTIEAIKNPRLNVVSVEGSRSLYEFMKAKDTVSQSKNLDLMYVDIGPTLGKSYPANDERKELWPNYSEEAFKKYGSNFDTILVNERFKVACALMCIKYCPNALIMIHDFTVRPEYQVLLKFLDQVEKANSLCVFKVKKGVNLREIEALYQSYKYTSY